jgi:hypothetical protein
MALFFQLISPADLRGLSPGEIEALKAAFYRELHTNETIKDELRHRISQTLQDIREATQAPQQESRQAPNPDETG